MKLLLAGILGFALGCLGTFVFVFLPVKHALSLPSIYATTTGSGAATCYANGRAWPARVDGTTINCFAADMPKN